MITVLVFKHLTLTQVFNYEVNKTDFIATFMLTVND